MTTSPLSVFSTDLARTAKIQDDKLHSAWRSPSNIALIKYWGKKEGQHPANASLSMTLSQAFTETSVTALRSQGPALLININGDNAHPFLPKLQVFFQWLIREIPVFNGFSYCVETKNSFPHSTGIASSASGMSAFTLCMLDIASQIANVDLSREETLHLASFASRMGSGSACRSLFGGFSVWGESDIVAGSSDQYAITINDLVHPGLDSLHDAILVVSSRPKSVASTLGHSLMNDHPFAGARFMQARTHLEQILTALKAGDLERLGNISETEALTLHSLIMISRGGGLLFEPGSITIMRKIKEARDFGLPVFYTLDAGPNVHLLYPDAASDKVEAFIRSELLQFCEDGQVIFDHRGEGPVAITERND